jgi:hypothetical protein
MKKKNVIVICIAGIISLIVTGVVIIFAVNNSGNSNVEVKHFSVDDYSESIAMFPSTEKLNPITDAESAKAEAERLWFDIYGKEGILNEKPYDVAYDSANKVWLVCGTLPRYVDGGVAYALIKEDGTVLAVWHEK